MVLNVKFNFLKACLKAHSFKTKKDDDSVLCTLIDYNLLKRPIKNQLGHACHFHEQRPQSWIFPKRYQVQGHILPFVPSCSNTNFCVLIDIWVYFIGLPEKFCYRNVQWLIFAVKNGHKNPKIDQKWQSWFRV